MLEGDTLTVDGVIEPIFLFDVNEGRAGWAGFQSRKPDMALEAGDCVKAEAHTDSLSQRTGAVLIVCCTMSNIFGRKQRFRRIH